MITFDTDLAWEVWRSSDLGKDLVFDFGPDQQKALNSLDDLRHAETGSARMARDLQQPRLPLAYTLVQRAVVRTVIHK